MAYKSADLEGVVQHVNPKTLDQYLRGEMSASESTDVSNHILWCSECRDVVNEYRKLVSFFQTLRSKMQEIRSSV